MAAALNLSNEVVKLRPEVNRVKVLVLRKLTRQIAALKNKKGTQADLERNERRMARLLEEIHELKKLAPDTITKAALQQDITFQEVCQSAASLSERAMARVATHPQFSGRIQRLKDALEAFKVERIRAAKALKKAKRESGGSVLQQSSPDEEEEDDGEREQVGKERREEHGGDDDSAVTHKAEGEGLNDTTKQNQSVAVTTKEKSSETDRTPTEVKRMRKEVKKLRMLLIRKFTQQITNLRRAKVKGSEPNDNEQCIATLQKDIQVLRALVSDHVTITVLQGKVDLENVLQDPNSSLLERVTARIATHPRFIKKLEDVRKAIEEEKTKVASADQRNEGEEGFNEVTQAENSGDDDDDDDDDEVEEEEVEDEDMVDTDDSGDDKTEDEQTKVMDHNVNVTKGYNAVKLSEDAKSHTKIDTRATKSKVGVPKQEVDSSIHLKCVSKTTATAGIVKSLLSNSKGTPLKKAPPGRKQPRVETKEPENRGGREESDLELSDGDEEKEYFDDSTEERFHKQSSQSEESDDDDFFLGKVSKLKKKKSDVAPGEEKKNDATSTARLQKTKEAPQVFKVQSVFCSTLSKSSDVSQKGTRSDPKPRRSQNQKKCFDGDAKPSWFKRQDPRTDRSHNAFNKKSAGPKGPGPGTRMAVGARFEKKPAQGNEGGPARPGSRPRPPQQALHPSWEASRKRKEQQALIAAFQGKKIKFDD
ncbi:serum response factor-binding protein 1 [Brachyhypopomus gauderio]|uniref:serum response factor-binding protein 1 n=1 Tax=Brachyhypopomus gauderio TaxID=698409 RepID=UPI00404252EA